MNAEKRKAEEDLREAEAQVSAAWKALGGAAPRERERYEKALKNAGGVSYPEAAELLAALLGGAAPRERERYEKALKNAGGVSHPEAAQLLAALLLAPEEKAVYDAAFGEDALQEAKWRIHRFPMTEIIQALSADIESGASENDQEAGQELDTAAELMQILEQALEADATEKELAASKDLEAAEKALKSAAPLEWESYRRSRGILATSKMRALAPVEYDRCKAAKNAVMELVAETEIPSDISFDSSDPSKGVGQILKRIIPKKWAEYEAAAAAYVKAVEESSDSTTKYVRF